MIHKILTLNLLNPYLQILFSLFFIIGFHGLCNHISKKFFFFKNSELNIFLKNGLIFFILVFILNIFIWSNLYRVLIVLLYLFIILIIIFSINFLINFTLEKKNIFNKKLLFIFLFLFLYFFISLFPTSDADSIAYHSAFGSLLIANENINWIRDIVDYQPQFYLVGSLEILNFFGLFFGIENFNSLFSHYFLCLFLYQIFSYINKDYNFEIKYFLSLSILSSPMLISILFSQKPYLISVLFLSYLYFYLLNEFKIKNKSDQILICIIFFNLIFTKVYFIPFIILGFLIVFLKSKQKFFLLKFNILLSLIFFLPYLIKNFIYFNDFFPPFLGSLLGYNEILLNEFVKDIRNYDLYLSLKNLLFLPILLIIPYTINNGFIDLNFLNFTKSLGVGIINVFFLRSLKSYYLFFLILFLIPIALGNISNRWFFLFFITINIFLLNQKKINNFLFLVVKLQSFISIIALCFIIYTFAPSYISKDYKEKILIDYAFEFHKSQKILEVTNNYKLSNNDLSVYNSRNNFWLSGDKRLLNLGVFTINNNSITGKNFENFLTKKEIKLIFSDKNIILHIVKNLNKDCYFEIGSFDFKIGTRNPFNNVKDNLSYIYIKQGTRKCYLY